LKASLRQPRVPAVESWIEEVLAEASTSDDESAVNLIERDPYDGSEPILSSCLRPVAGAVDNIETLRPNAGDTLRPTGESMRPAIRELRRSDLSELSAQLEGDELDLLRFNHSA
jgi:hypothetical protein